MKKLDAGLFVSAYTNYSLENDQNNLAGAFYKFRRDFHLLGRNDNKDLFSVSLVWKFLGDQLKVSSYDSDEEIKDKLNQLNSKVDGQKGQNSESIGGLKRDIDRLQGVVDLNVRHTCEFIHRKDRTKI